MHDPAAPNWIGLRTLYMREIRRFAKVYTQTIMAPVVTTLLFLAIFSLALGGEHRVVAGLPFEQFLGPDNDGNCPECVRQYVVVDHGL